MSNMDSSVLDRILFSHMHIVCTDNCGNKTIDQLKKNGKVLTTETYLFLF